MNRLISDDAVASWDLSAGRDELLRDIFEASPIRSKQPRRWQGWAPALGAVVTAAMVAAVWTSGWLDGAAKVSDPADPGTGVAAGPVPGPADGPAGSATPDSERSLQELGDGRMFEMPARPLLSGSDQWRLADISPAGSDVVDFAFVGPQDAVVNIVWVGTGDPDDPFSYERYDRRGREFDVLGVRARLVGFSEGGRDYQVVLTPGVTDDGTSLLLETADLDRAAMKEFARTLQWVEPEEFRAALTPAVQTTRASPDQG